MGSGGSQSILINASARIRSQAGPKRGWPRSTVRISTPSTTSSGAPQDQRIDDLDATAVGAKTAVADDQRQSDRVDSENQRPFLRDDVKQALDAVGLDRGQYGVVDRGDRARMAARERDQILVGLLYRAEPLRGGAQPRALRRELPSPSAARIRPTGG